MDLQERVDFLETALQRLCVFARQDMDCIGYVDGKLPRGTKPLVNWVHDYAAQVLDGEMPSLEKD